MEASLGYAGSESKVTGLTEVRPRELRALVTTTLGKAWCLGEEALAQDNEAELFLRSSISCVLSKHLKNVLVWPFCFVTCPLLLHS